MASIEIVGGGERARALARARLEALLPRDADLHRGLRIDVDVVADERLRHALASGAPLPFCAEAPAGRVAPDRRALFEAVNESAAASPIGTWLPATCAPLAGERRRVRVFAHATGATGYAAVGRELLLGLRARGWAATWHAEWGEHGEAGLDDDEVDALLAARDEPYRLDDPAIFARPATLPDGNPFLAEYAHARTRGARIAYVMFETDAFPGRYARALEAFDRIWVPSAFNAETFARAGVDPRRIDVVPIGIDAPRYDVDGPRVALPHRRRTAFLSAFEWNERKGFDVLLHAWAQAFSPDDDVTLYVRSGGPNHVGAGPADLPAAALAAGVDLGRCAPIVALSSTLRRREYEALLRSVDAFVLASRGEAFCIPMLEAMASGCSVIGTAFGGANSFLDPTTGFPIAYRLRPIDGPLADRMPSYRAQRWAEPDVTELIAALQRVAGNDSDVRSRTARGHARAHLFFDRLATAGCAGAAIVAASRERWWSGQHVRLDGDASGDGPRANATRAALRELDALGVHVSLTGASDAAAAAAIDEATARRTRAAREPIVAAAHLTVEHAGTALIVQPDGLPAIVLAAPGPDLSEWTPDVGPQRDGTLRALVHADDHLATTADVALRSLAGIASAELLVFAPRGVDVDTVMPALERAARSAARPDARIRLLPLDPDAGAAARFAAAADLAVVIDPDDPCWDALRGAAVPLAGDAATAGRFIADAAHRRDAGRRARATALARAAEARIRWGEQLDSVIPRRPATGSRPAGSIALASAPGAHDLDETIARLTAQAVLTVRDDAPYIALIGAPLVTVDGWDDLLTTALETRPRCVAAEPFYAPSVEPGGPLAAYLPAGEDLATRLIVAFGRYPQAGALAQGSQAPLRVVRRSDSNTSGPVRIVFACYAEPGVA